MLNDRYWILTSTPLSNNPFRELQQHVLSIVYSHFTLYCSYFAAGDLVGCGVRRTCVRLCGNFHGNPVCSLDEAEYVLIIDVDSAGREAMFTLGGRIRNPEVSSSICKCPLLFKALSHHIIFFLDVRQFRHGQQRFLPYRHGYECLHGRPGACLFDALLCETRNSTAISTCRCK